MKNLTRGLTLLFFTFLIVGCNDEDETPSGKYDGGVWVINEGNFTDSDGSVTYRNQSTSEITQKIFELENERPLAGLLQSITVYNDRAYLVDNTGSRIEIVNNSDFVSVGVITESLNSPRYFAAANGKGYVSNWGPFSEDFSLNESFVLVFDLETFNVIKEIPVASGPEGIIEAGGRIYVNSSFTDKLSIIDPSSDEVVQEITIPFGCGQVVKDASENIWAACTSGSLISVNTSTNVVASNTLIENLSGKLSLDANNGIIYTFTSEFAPDFSFTSNSVLSILASLPGSQTSIYESRNIYGVGVSNSGQEVYIGNSNAFQGNGTAIILDPSGNEIDNFPTGRGPNGFVFRD